MQFFIGIKPIIKVCASPGSIFSSELSSKNGPLGSSRLLESFFKKNNIYNYIQKNSVYKTIFFTVMTEAEIFLILIFLMHFCPMEIFPKSIIFE